MNKILFCQFSTNLINKDFSKKEISNLYYSTIWKARKKEGGKHGKHELLQVSKYFARFD